MNKGWLGIFAFTFIVCLSVSCGQKEQPSGFLSDFDPDEPNFSGLWEFTYTHPGGKREREIYRLRENGESYVRSVRYRREDSGGRFFGDTPLYDISAANGSYVLHDRGMVIRSLTLSYYTYGSHYGAPKHYRMMFFGDLNSRSRVGNTLEYRVPAEEVSDGDIFTFYWKRNWTNINSSFSMVVMKKLPEA